MTIGQYIEETLVIIISALLACFAGLCLVGLCLWLKDGEVVAALAFPGSFMVMSVYVMTRIMHAQALRMHLREGK